MYDITDMGKNTKPNPNLKKKQIKNIGFAIIMLLIGMIIISYAGSGKKLDEVALSDVVKRANSGEIDTLTIKGSTVEVTKKGEKEATEKAYKEAGSSIYEQGLSKEAPVKVNPKPESNTAGAVSYTHLTLPTKA